MPYQKISDLPKSVKDALPAHAQEIYKDAFNNSWEEYADREKRREPESSREEVAHRVAWAAVKQKYEKAEDGKWHAK